MSKNLLDGVNEVLKRVQVLDSNNGELSSLTDSARQVYIDSAIQVWNEGIDELYSISSQPKPRQLEEDTLTLKEGDRDYPLATDLVSLYYPLLDEVNGQYITEYAGGYWQMIKDQPFPDSFKGLPHSGAIRPTDGELYLDFIPQAEDAGATYTYRYDRDLELSCSTDTFPFSDTVFRAMVPAIAELWNLVHKNSFNTGLSQRSFGRAARLLTQTKPRESWKPMSRDVEDAPFG